MSQAQAAVHHTVEITNSSHAFKMSALRHLVKTVGFPLCRQKFEFVNCRFGAVADSLE